MHLSSKVHPINVYRTGASKAGLMASLTIDSGTTVPNSAVTRGDAEIVKILLENSVDPYVEQRLGRLMCLASVVRSQVRLSV